MLRYIPNIITLFRVFLVFVFIYIFNSDISNKSLVSAGVFILSGISDVLDGYIARKFNIVSNFGKLMDPLADKLMQITVAVCIASVEKTLIWVPIVLVLKEVSMIFGAARLLKKENIVVCANKFGKIASIMYFLVFSVLIIFKNINPAIKQIMCISFVVVSIIAFINYLKFYIKVYKDIKKEASFL